MRNRFALIIIIAASFTVFAHSLRLASDKPFWGDEVYELHDCLDRPVLQMLFEGVHGSPSPTPLYFMIQRVVVSALLSFEKTFGAGMDWQISMRIVPAIFLSIFTLLTGLLLLSLNWLLAIGFVTTFASNNLVIWFGAENRVYGPWLALVIFFYAASLRLYLGTSKLDHKLWILFSALLPLTVITSPSVVLTVATVILLLRLRKFPTSTSKVWPTILIGTVLMFLVFSIYNTDPRSMSLEALKTSFSWPHFLSEGMVPFAGPERAVRFVALSLLLFLVGFIPKLTYRKIYSFIGLLGLSQAALFVITYCLLYASSYFFAPRHAIFIAGARALVTSGLVLLVFELLSLGMSYFKFQKKISAVAISIMTLVVCKDWFAGRVMGLPEAFAKVSPQYKPYCHGPVWVRNRFESEVVDTSGIPTFEFNTLNKGKHSGRCNQPGRTGDGKFFDFAPQWIYGIPTIPNPQ